MIKLKNTSILLAICAIIIQIAHATEEKCNLDGTKLVCTGIDDDGLVANIKKYQPTHFVCNECTCSKLNLQQLDVETRKKIQKIEIIELLNELDMTAMDTFNGLENLYSIKFQNTTIKSLEPELFKPLTKLDEASFLRVDVRKKVEHCFKYTPQLRKFALTNIRINNIGAKWFVDTPNLVELDFSETNIQNIDADSFKSLTKLEKIILRKNDIKSLPTELFDNQPELKYLDISGNPINEIAIRHIIQTNAKLDVFLMYDLPCQTFESKAEILQNDLQFVTECVKEGTTGPYGYKTSCVQLRAYDKRTPNDKLTIFEAADDVVSDENFNGLPCVSNNKAKNIFKPLP